MNEAEAQSLALSSSYSAPPRLRVSPSLRNHTENGLLTRSRGERGEDKDLSSSCSALERQKVIRFEYDGMVFEEGFRIDLLVDGRVIIELKSIERLAPVHGKQLLTYLRLMRLPVGLLINFGAGTL
jgi:GxxExxY protein